MVIGNNGIWGLEKHPMHAIYGYDVVADLQPECRYDEVVRALGGAGEIVTDPDQVGPALDRGFAAGVPYLVNVVTDPADVYPRVPGGLTPPSHPPNRTFGSCARVGRTLGDWTPTITKEIHHVPHFPPIHEDGARHRARRCHRGRAYRYGLGDQLRLRPPRPTAPRPSARPPGASPATVLAAIQAKGAAAISQREGQLQKLGTALAATPGCDTGGTVAGIITADEPALTALGVQLAAETSVPPAKTDFAAIFQNYRVYLLVTPQVNITVNCGRVLTADATLTTAEQKLAGLVQQAAAKGEDMTAAEASLADMTTQLSNATTQANAAYTEIAGLVPDKGVTSVEQSNALAIQTAHGDLGSARGDLTAAVGDAKAVVGDLKAAKSASPATGTADGSGSRSTPSTSVAPAAS